MPSKSALKFTVNYSSLFCNFYTFSFLTPIIERSGYYCLSQTFRDSHRVQLIDKCLYISLMISHVFYLSVRIVITLMICLSDICYPNDNQYIFT